MTPTCLYCTVLYLLYTHLLVLAVVDVGSEAVADPGPGLQVHHHVERLEPANQRSVL